MQTPEDYLRQRSQPPPPPSSSASQIAVFVASFAAVCAALYFAQTTPAPVDVHVSQSPPPGEVVADMPDADLIRAVESFLKSGDPAFTSALTPIVEFAASPGGSPLLPDDIAATLNDLSRLVEPYAESLSAQQSALDALKTVQTEAAAVQRAYSEQRADLTDKSPRLISDLDDLKQRQAAVDAAVAELNDAERAQAELGADLQRAQARIAELERAADAAQKAWRQHVDQKLTPLKETVDYSAERLARRLQEAKSSSGKVSVLRRELQTHSVILTESATKIAALTHQKTILESRLKSIEQLGHDLQRNANTDVSLQGAIDKQKQRLETVKSEYGSLPDEPTPAGPKPVDVGADQAPTELPGYKKKLMQIAVDEAERKLAWLQELQSISRRHDDGNDDGVKDEALRSFIELKKSEIANELASTVSEISSERTWQERIVAELNDKNEQLKVLERDMSSDAIGELRAQVDHARAVHADAETEAKALERASLQAGRRLDDAHAESAGLHERLVAQKEKARRLHESHAALIRDAHRLRQRVAGAARASRDAMQEVERIGVRAQQLQAAFGALTGQYADAERRRRAQEGQVRDQLARLCRALE